MHIGSANEDGYAHGWCVVILTSDSWEGHGCIGEIRPWISYVNIYFCMDVCGGVAYSGGNGQLIVWSDHGYYNV